MQGTLRVAIVGYGVAGQAACLFLGAAGHALTVFEQAASPGRAGALGSANALTLLHLPIAHGQMLRILTGTKRHWW